MKTKSTVLAVLSLIVAPAILTNASTVLVMSTSNRLARTGDRARELSKQLEEAGALTFLSGESFVASWEVACHGN